MPAVQTIAFTTTDSTFSFTINGISAGTWDRLEELDARHRIDATDNEIVVALNNGTYFSFTIYNTDTVTINDVEWTGTIRELHSELKDEVFFTAPSAASEVVVYQTKVILTDAQIKALPTTAVEIVPAPGASKCIAPLGGFVKINTLGGAYTNITDASLALIVDSSYFSNIIPIEFILNNTTEKGLPISCPNLSLADSGTFAGVLYPATIDMSGITNAPLLIQDANYGAGTDYTGGNAANTMEVTVFYSIIDL